jgi:hypothetical protein
MNHWSFVAIAYSAFALLLFWDFIAPRLALNKSVRALTLRLRRKKSL